MDLLIIGSMGLGFLIGVAAFIATMREADRYFNEKPSWDRISSYRVPYVMMIAMGLCFVPVAGIAYALAMWAAYFSGKRFG